MPEKTKEFNTCGTVYKTDKKHGSAMIFILQKGKRFCSPML